MRGKWAGVFWARLRPPFLVPFIHMCVCMCMACCRIHEVTCMFTCPDLFLNVRGGQTEAQVQGWLGWKSKKKEEKTKETSDKFLQNCQLSLSFQYVIHYTWIYILLIHPDNCESSDKNMVAVWTSCVCVCTCAKYGWDMSLTDVRKRQRLRERVCWRSDWLNGIIELVWSEDNLMSQAEGELHNCGNACFLQPLLTNNKSLECVCVYSSYKDVQSGELLLSLSHSLSLSLSSFAGVAMVTGEACFSGPIISVEPVWMWHFPFRRPLFDADLRVFVALYHHLSPHLQPGGKVFFFKGSMHHISE